MINYIKPACMSYYYDESGRQEYGNPVTKSIAYTSDGYLLPCCWCDAPSTRKDFIELGFYDERLKLSNNKSVLDIISVNIWGEFIKTIMHDPANAPRCCRERCGITID